MKKTYQNLVGEGKDEDDDSFRKSKSNLEVKETSEYKNMISDQLYNIPKKTHSEKKQVTRQSFIVISKIHPGWKTYHSFKLVLQKGQKIHESRAIPPTLQK